MIMAEPLSRKAPKPLGEAHAEPPPPEPTPETELVKRARREVNLAELQEKLNAAMQRLSEPHRLVVTLHDVQGLSHEEIAEIMDCNIGTVRSRLFYARQQMQAYLSDYLK